MAETNKGIYYPTFAEIGEETYDGPVRMKMMAESIDLLLLSNEDKTKLDNIESGAEVNVIETVKVNGIALTPSNKAVDVPVPTKTSDLNNDSGFIDKDVNNLTNYYDKNAVDTKISAVYKYKGTVSTYNDLPSTNLTIGDVYNIETADSTHGVKAGDNVAWNGTAWDVLAGTVDLSGYQTKIDSSHKLASDLVDDTNSTHKFVTSEEKTQISTNATDIDNIKDGTEIDSFGDVETVLAEKQEQIDNLVEDYAIEIKELLQSSNITHDKYYSHNTNNVGDGASFSIFEPIDVFPNITYILKNCMPYFTNIVYVDGSKNSLSDISSPMTVANFEFTPTKPR